MDWPKDTTALLMRALGEARAAGGDASEAARLILGARNLHSRVRGPTADRLFNLARCASKVDARVAAAGVQPSPEQRDAWRVAALLVGEEHRAAVDVAAATGLPMDVVALLGGDAYLANRTGSERLALQHAMPDWLVARLCEEHDVAFVEALLASLNARAPLFVRARVDRAQLLAGLQGAGVDAVPTRFSPVGLELRSHLNVRGLDAFKHGDLEVQDEGSQLIALALGARDGELILDGCAGAGGKTLALCALTPRATVVAVEPVAARLSELRERASRAHVAPEMLCAAMGSPRTRAFENRVDAILLDAPCSGTGAMRREPASRWRYQQADIATFVETQQQILRAAAPLLKPGGRLVYATCSLLRAENEAVLDAVLPTLPGLRPRALATTLGETLAAALGVQGHTLRLWPHVHGTDGFFMALLERVA